ncbi:activating signal cointegrator 1 complex subunit [Coemansia sp. S610]|nr:activating signal cointegrator 1 complex subunit [Coemansia sp. S610]KAJ2382579.1 activating signal cointegrator 1 complex subunit [Coemansia sp. RSA 2611]KAJ2411685.1 activating signal cointegrator 1 complex subunit [Coemansia sp. RSA 2530]KAJ2700018.1 activating signal cointegrator 1 complex subunit [Coemansia sp. IMI 209128]
MNQVFKIVEVGTRRYRVRTPLGGLDDTQLKSGNAAVVRQQMTVPQQLHKLLTGSSISRIQAETKAQIRVSHGDTIELEGSVGEVAAAKKRIQKVIDEGTQTIPYTHFISLPIGDSDVQRRVGVFQSEIKEFLRGANSSTMCDPAKLHVTVGMLRLLDPGQVASAVELLKSLQPQVHDVLGGRPLVIKLGHVAAMEDNPAKARTIYAGAQDFSNIGDDRLRLVCELVRSAFDEAGYIDEKRELKIHVSLIRTKVGRAAGGGGFDATRLLKKHGKASLGTCRIGRIEIAHRFRFTEGGAYASEGSLVLP